MKFFLLGSEDPEMVWIEQQLLAYQIPYGYAGRFLWDKEIRIRRGSATRAKFIIFRHGSPDIPPDGLVVVECRYTDRLVWDQGVLVSGGKGTSIPVQVVDHHNQGDPGYGLGPDNYWEASSLGQVMSIIDPDFVPMEPDRIVAAADHCLLAAYQGQCPGVDPEALGIWRVEQRSYHRKVSIKRVLKQIEDAASVLMKARKIPLGNQQVADLRGKSYPELKEAACRLSIPYVTRTLPNEFGRCKIVLGGANASAVIAFKRGDSLASELIHRYGDPARGFAGGLESRARKS